MIAPEARGGGVVAVLGPGGVGGLIAARTNAVCVGTKRSVAAIRERGLTFVRGNEQTVVRAEAVERLERPVALIVVAVKAFHLDAALERIPPEFLDGAVVLPLLNGLEHVEYLRERLGTRCAGENRSPVVLAGSIGRVEALSPEPGVVVQLTAADPVVTVASDTLRGAALARALAPLRVPGIELVVADDERAVLWEKAVRLAVLAAATAASGLPVGALRDEEGWRDQIDTALHEACAVAVADGVPLDPVGQWAIIEAMPFDLTTSAARDRAAGRATELDAITGSVVRAARRLGVGVPTLSGLLADATASSG